jgi:hypothetical protein
MWRAELIKPVSAKILLKRVLSRYIKLICLSNTSVMKKTNILLFTFAVMIGMIVIQSCQTTGKTSSATKMLKFNFEKGKGYDYELITNMDQEIMGQEMKMDITFYYSMDVTEDDGTIKTITTAIDRFKMKMGMAGMNIDIDTDKPLPSLGVTEDGKDPMKMLNSLFGAIKGQKFSIKVDAEGKVQEVTGFENMANTIVDSMSIDEDQRQEMKKKFDEQFNSEKMKSQLGRIFYIFPNKEVKIGDSWQKNSMVAGDMAGSYISTYKVTDIEGDMVTLSENTKVESSEDKMNLTGDIKGTIVVDSRLGLVVNADQDMKMKLGAAGKEIEIKAKTKIKGKAR